MAPLGFDWKMTIGIITGVAAKEIVISTLGVLYLTANPEEDEGSSLKEKLQAQVYTEGPKAGQKVFNKLVAFSYMLFILLYFPCIAVIAAISRESGSWKWGLFAVVYTTGIAWVVSFLVYQIGSLFS
jgi:ferrous iron transport protein B